jgi:hypothetical protein
MVKMMRFLAVALVCAGCGNGSMMMPPPPGGAIEVTPTEYDATAMTQTELGDGAPLDLVRPPQGGFVVFVGAEVRNVGESTVLLSSRLIDGAGNVINEDARTIGLKAQSGDVYVPDLRSYTNVANIAVCPTSPTSTVDRFDQPATLEVTVTEPSSKRMGQVSLAVTPVCRQTDPTELALCKCQCAAAYMLGKCM